MAKKVVDKKISLFFLIMVSSALVTSIRNLPTIAETGLKMLFFAGIAALCYFIPAALTSAELASGWPKTGGIYVWAKEAFGRRLGFFTIWMQWNYMTISVIAMVYFIGGSLAFVFDPSLAENRIFLIIVQLFVVWLFTFLNCKGMHTSSLISTIGFLSGVLFPGIFIIVLGIIYMFLGNPVQVNLTPTTSNFFPDFTHIATLVLLVGFMRAFAGIEASSAHASKVDNPQRNYPIAIFIVVIIGLSINVLGSMSVAVVVPQKEISLIAGIMEAFTSFFKRFQMLWLVPIMGFLVAIGQTGGVSTWLMSPVKGLLATAKNGDLPYFFQKVNKHEVPTNLLIMQAIVISIIGSVLLLLPSINIAFWFSVALSMMIYVTMYFLMFLSGLRLRYSQPKIKRPYHIPGKHNIGMWVSSTLGMITMVFAFIIAFFPPAQLPTKNHNGYVTLLIIGIVLVYIIPIVIMLCRRPSWAQHKKILKKR